LNIDSVNITMDANETSTNNVTIYNTGEMDLNYSIDPYGYQLENSDNNTYDWVDIEDNYQTLSFDHNDNASDDIVYFDFNFPFYNNNYSSLIVNPNGWIGFGEDNAEWFNTGLPNVDAPLNAIMPFWDDLNPDNSGNSSNMEGVVKYQTTNNQVIVWYDNVRHWVGTGEIDGYYDFQVILYSNGDIDFNYRSMTGDTNSATIGIQDETGTSALVVSVNNNLIHSEFSVYIQPKPLWLNVSPLSDSIAPGESENLSIQLNTENLNSGIYEYNLEIASNDFHSPITTLPINLSITDLPCDGFEPGDINSDGEFNVLDIIHVVNFILYGYNDECELILSDLNEDSNIDVLDIVLIVNLILS